MELTYGTDLERFRRSVRGVLEQGPQAGETMPALTGASMDGSLGQLWRRLCTELEIPGLTVAEAHGGAGGGIRELVLVAEEIGRALLPLPVFGTLALACPLLGALEGEDGAAALLASVAAGASLVAVALIDAPQAAVRAEPGADGWRCQGTKTYVVDAVAADLLLVRAQSPDGPVVLSVDPTAPGVEVAGLPSLDQTRSLAQIRFRAAPAELVGPPARAEAAVAHALEIATIALAAECVGGASRILEITADYARERHQFGRPIGSFQAVKHHLADLLADVEMARSTAYHAGWVADAQAADDAGEDEAGGADLALAVSLAALRCGDAYVRVAAGAIQVHGGIGVTWDHVARLYYTRAKSSQLLLRPSGFHRDRLAALI